MEPQPLNPQRAKLAQGPPGLLGHSRDLWRDAPAWRLLVGSTVALLTASVATSQMAPRYDASTLAPVTAPVSERAAYDAVETRSSAHTPQIAPDAPAPLVQMPAPAPFAPPHATPSAQYASRPASPEIQLTPAPFETACNYRGGGGSGGQGRVLGFLSRDQAANLLERTQNKTGAKINPDYVRNVRVVLTVADGRRVVVLLPPSLTVKPGDRVAFASGHRDWSMACGYIPNLIIGLLQPG